MKTEQQRTISNISMIVFILFIPFLASCGSGSGPKEPTAQAAETSQPVASSNASGSTRGTDTAAAPPAATTTADPGTADSTQTANPVGTGSSTTAPGAPAPTPTPSPSTGTGQTTGGGTPSVAASHWQGVGGHVNSAKEGPAFSTVLTTVQGTPYLVWKEGQLEDGTWVEGKKIYFAGWSGTEWRVEGPLNFNLNNDATIPTVATDGQALYLSWVEGADGDKTAYVLRKDAGSWVTVAAQEPPTGSGCAPLNAGLTIWQGLPTLAWDPVCSDTQYTSTAVEQWKGNWVSLGGAGSHYADTPDPRKYQIASNGEQLSLAVISQNGAFDGMTIDLFHHTGDGWIQDGGPANDPQSYVQSVFSLAFVQKLPTLAFQQQDLGIRVRQWTGKEWTTLGGTISKDGIDPALVTVGDTLYLGFGGPRVSVLRWDGAAWTPKGDGLSQTPGAIASSVSLAAAGPQLFAAWIENGSILVKSLSTQ